MHHPTNRSQQLDLDPDIFIITMGWKDFKISVINSKFITEPRGEAEIVAQAFKEKFTTELEGKPFE